MLNDSLRRIVGRRAVGLCVVGRRVVRRRVVGWRVGGRDFVVGVMCVSDDHASRISADLTISTRFDFCYICYLKQVRLIRGMLSPVIISG